jgi:hypothetical protein
MKPARSIEPHRTVKVARSQRGDALFEALIGTVLGSIVGLGFAYTATRMLVAQQVSDKKTFVLEQMVNTLSSSPPSNVCTNTSQVAVTVGTATMSMQPAWACNSAVSVSAGGVQQTLPAGTVATGMTLSTPDVTKNDAANILFGGNGGVTISQ